MAELWKPLSIEDAYEIFASVKKRHENFPDEPIDMTWILVLRNIGDRYSEVVCMNEKHAWKGIKKDIPKSDGIPTCPEGHALTQGAGLTLGWLPINNK